MVFVNHFSKIKRFTHKILGLFQVLILSFLLLLGTQEKLLQLHISLVMFFRF